MVEGALALAGAAGGLTLIILKSSVAEEDVLDVGVRGRDSASLPQRSYSVAIK